MKPEPSTRNTCFIGFSPSPAPRLPNPSVVGALRTFFEDIASAAVRTIDFAVDKLQKNAGMSQRTVPAVAGNRRLCHFDNFNRFHEQAVLACTMGEKP